MLLLVAADRLDQLLLRALEQAALRDRGVEAGLEVLEGQRVVEDADVALAETASASGSPRASSSSSCRRVSSSSSPQAARKAPAAPVPPVSTRNLRREKGSRAARAMALRSGLRGYGHVYLTSIRGLVRCRLAPARPVPRDKCLYR